MVSLYHKVLAQPFVYDQVRPRVIGGIDLGPIYQQLAGSAAEVVLDVGCGTGDALRHLTAFKRYLGVDTDPGAIETARRRYGERAGVRFECKMLDAADIVDLSPTGVVLAGVLHHLSNDQAEAILRLASASPRLEYIATGDIVFMPGMFFNNVFAMLDRGRYCRHPDAYSQLARCAGFDVVHASIHDASPTNGRMKYYAMTLRRR
jgi:SAM-dependent methyltransferase